MLHRQAHCPTEVPSTSLSLRSGCWVHSLDTYDTGLTLTKTRSSRIRQNSMEQISAIRRLYLYQRQFKRGLVKKQFKGFRTHKRAVEPQISN
jgi:hypothetical protein